MSILALLWGYPHGNLPKRSIIISRGKENKSDSVSNGERKRIRPNRIPTERIGRCGVWSQITTLIYQGETLLEGAT